MKISVQRKRDNFEKFQDHRWKFFEKVEPAKLISGRPRVTKLVCNSHGKRFFLFATKMHLYDSYDMLFF